MELDRGQVAPDTELAEASGLVTVVPAGQPRQNFFSIARLFFEFSQEPQKLIRDRDRSPVAGLRRLHFSDSAVVGFVDRDLAVSRVHVVPQKRVQLAVSKSRLNRHRPHWIPGVVQSLRRGKKFAQLIDV